MEDKYKNINSQEFLDGSLPSELKPRHINNEDSHLLSRHEKESVLADNGVEDVDRPYDGIREEDLFNYTRNDESANKIQDTRTDDRYFDGSDSYGDLGEMADIYEAGVRDGQSDSQYDELEKYGLDLKRYKTNYSAHNDGRRDSRTYSQEINGKKISKKRGNLFSNNRSYSTAEVLRSQAKYKNKEKFNLDLSKSDLRSFRYSDLSKNINNSDELLRDLNLSDSSRLNIPLIIVVVCMLCFGLVMLYSASMTRGFQESGNTADFVIRQLIFSIIGIVSMSIFSLFDVRKLDKMFVAIVYYFITLMLLLLVLVPGIGRLVNNQRRWLPIPGTGITFQPSEISKVGVIFCLAVYFGEIKRRRDRGYYISAHPHKQKWLDAFLDITFPFLIVLSWCIPISFQSHMSAVGIMLFMTFIVLLLNGLPIRSWIFGGLQLLAVGLVMVIIIYAVMPFLPSNFSNRWSHLVQRINIFTESEEATEADVYQTQQAEIAIGSGGLTGLGLGQGKQKYNYLPENHNDYIFSSIVEELGFVGGISVIILFLILLAIGLGISLRTRDRYGLTLSGGITILLVTQAILSISVNVGTFPPTGISLPFFSYGGSANLIFLSIVGILLSVSRYNRSTAERLAKDEISRRESAKRREDAERVKFNSNGRAYSRR